MVFHWSSSDSKSLQVYRTYHSILTDLNSVVVWIISTLLLFPSLSLPLPFLWGLFYGHKLRLVTPLHVFFLVTPSHSRPIAFFFSILYYGLRTYISFCFLPNLLCFLLGRPQFGWFSFLFHFISFLFIYFVDYHDVWSSGRNYIICLYLKIL